jgi:hypothetical protein
VPAEDGALNELVRMVHGVKEEQAVMRAALFELQRSMESLRAAMTAPPEHTKADGSAKDDVGDSTYSTGAGRRRGIFSFSGRKVQPDVPR